MVLTIIEFPIQIISNIYSFFEDNRHLYKKKNLLTKSKNINKKKIFLDFFIQKNADEFNFKYFKQYYVKFLAQKTSKSPKTILIKKNAFNIFPNLITKFIYRLFLIEINKNLIKLNIIDEATNKEIFILKKINI